MPKFCMTFLLLAVLSVTGLAQRTPAEVTLPEAVAGPPAARSQEYARVQNRLGRGWNTWDTNTIAGEVLLPEGLETRLSLKRNSTLNGNAFLPTMLIGRSGPNEAQVKPGPHAYDGSFSRFDLKWAGFAMTVESAHAGDDLVMLVTPTDSSRSGNLPATAFFSAGFLWNRPGEVRKEDGRIVASSPGREISIYLAGRDSGDNFTPLQGPYFSAELSEPVGISTGKPRSVQEIRQAISREHDAFKQSHSKDPRTNPIREAIETTLAWDTIYEPAGNRVITPVSRVWNEMWGGYVLFDWDTFFAADLAAVGSRDLAYANLLEILNEMTPEGFVPNYGRAGNWKSFDRSEPPVGAITVLNLYRRYHDRWLLEDSFDRLLKWNRWWEAHRDLRGYLVWGSDAENRPVNPDDSSVGTLQGAKYESGIDNGPPFDGAYFNPATNQMEFADVGLISLYIADSNALAEIAEILGKRRDAQDLRDRARKYQASLTTLWDAKAGIFLSKDLHTGKFCERLSPTNFYPLLARAATPEQADEMVRRHLMNRDEFWGERVVPAIARNDPAFKDQDYWRGRIWAPMNYLLYEGLLNYETPAVVRARQELAEKSMKLFLHEWSEKGHVHENYSAIGDDSDNVPSSDAFYHWGALLGLMEYEELTRPGAAASEH
ncbi:MAG: MGH1-like glycoside hydrolase domain-containing protein [Deltaproteobacteria bacterium]